MNKNFAEIYWSNEVSYQFTDPIYIKCNVTYNGKTWSIDQETYVLRIEIPTGDTQIYVTVKVDGLCNSTGTEACQFELCGEKGIQLDEAQCISGTCTTLNWSGTVGTRANFSVRDHLIL